MVCSLETGRMAIMARLMSDGGFSQSAAEEVGRQKLATQLICREFCEADEANLLDERDMHVYGLEPMNDPLFLVCCNACKKPVKASQYAAHAELCRTLSATKGAILDFAGGSGLKKPPKKERKKIIGNSASIDAVPMKDVSGVSPENTEPTASVMPPPTKWSKSMAGKKAPLARDNLDRVLTITKTRSAQEASKCADNPRVTTSQIKMLKDSVCGCKTPGQVCEHSQLKGDISVPLATKVYYSQRNNRLRYALNHMYWKSLASSKEIGGDVECEQATNESVMPLDASIEGFSSLEQINDLLNKRMNPTSQKPDHLVSGSSEVSRRDKSGEHFRANSSSNPSAADNFARPQPAPAGMAKSKYLSKQISFPGNSGKPLSSMQQANGSVPVV